MAKENKNEKSRIEALEAENAKLRKEIRENKYPVLKEIKDKENLKVISARHNKHIIRQIMSIMICLSVAAFVFAAVFVIVGIAYTLDLPGIDNQRDAVIVINVFFNLMFIVSVAIATLAIVAFIALWKDKKVGGLALLSIIIIWTFATFIIAMRLVFLFVQAGIVTTLTDADQIICYAVMLVGPIAFILFGTILFVRVAHLYPERYEHEQTQQANKPRQGAK